MDKKRIRVGRGVKSTSITDLTVEVLQDHISKEVGKVLESRGLESQGDDIERLEGKLHTVAVILKDLNSSVALAASTTERSARVVLNELLDNMQSGLSNVHLLFEEEEGLVGISETVRTSTGQIVRRIRPVGADNISAALREIVNEMPEGMEGIEALAWDDDSVDIPFEED